MRVAVYAVVAAGLFAGTVYAGFNFGLPGVVKSQRKEVEKEILKKELVSVPSMPTGTTSGTVGMSYTYGTGGASSILGHTVEYRFGWGDETYSAWSTATSASHSWSAPGMKSVTAEARCQIHPIVTNLSAALAVTILSPETVSTPSAPTGLTAVTPGQSHLYVSNGSASNLGHPVEHRFEWGDGTYSMWSVSTSDLKSWLTVGIMPVRAHARCQIHPVVTVSSAELSVTVESVTAPNQPSGATSGTTGVPGTYSTGGTLSALGHPVEYRFVWGDGTFAPWSTSLSASKSWSTAGIKRVQAQARCQTHPAITSASTDLVVTITGPATGTISTVAGTGAPSYNGDGGLATKAELNYPHGPAVDSAGNIFIADSDNHRIRKVDGATGIISTVAGTGSQGYNGDGIAATSALLNTPIGITVDGSGNLFIADYGNHRIRRVDGATGTITTVAGTGSTIYNGDGIPATTAGLAWPTGTAVDASDNLWIADFDHDRIRKVDGATGVISTVAGTGVFGNSGDGGPATTAKLGGPFDVAVDTAGNLFIADSGNHRVRKVDAGSGMISTIAGTGTFGYSGDGGTATTAQLDSPFGVAVAASGDLFIADTSNSRVRKVDASTGTISTIAGMGTAGYNGDGSAATDTQLNLPFGVIVDTSGNIFIADRDNHRIRKVGP